MAAGDPAFTQAEMRRIESSLGAAVRETGVDFSVFVGDVDSDLGGAALGTGDTRAVAERLHAALGARAEDAVLLLVAPGQRRIEVVTGAGARQRLPDRACGLAVLSMTSSFEGGDLVGGIVTGLRMLAETAGRDNVATR